MDLKNNLANFCYKEVTSVQHGSSFMFDLMSIN